MRWRVGAGSIFVVCPGCSLWIFSANGVHVAHTTRVHVKSCSFSWQDFVLSFLSSTTLFVSSWMHSSPVSIWNFLVEPPGLTLSLAVGDTTCSTSLQIKKQRQKRYFTLGGCRSLHTMLASLSLQEVWSFPVHFGSQLVLPPRGRWDLCKLQLHQLRRKPLREQFICQRFWRCTAHRDVKPLKILLRVVSVQPCRRGGLYVAGNVVFANAMASFSQCDWTFCLARWRCANEMQSKHIDMPLKERSASKTEKLAKLEGLTSDGRWIDASLVFCSVQFGKMLFKVMPS